jgi:membrane protein implicated in regulation of membrane protease activity
MGFARIRTHRGIQCRRWLAYLDRQPDQLQQQRRKQHDQVPIPAEKRFHNDSTGTIKSGGEFWPARLTDLTIRTS